MNNNELVEQKNSKCKYCGYIHTHDSLMYISGIKEKNGEFSPKIPDIKVTDYADYHVICSGCHRFLHPVNDLELTSDKENKSLESFDVESKRRLEKIKIFQQVFLKLKEFKEKLKIFNDIEQIQELVNIVISEAGERRLEYSKEKQNNKDVLSLIDAENFFLKQKI